MPSTLELEGEKTQAWGVIGGRHTVPMAPQGESIALLGAPFTS